MARRLSGILPDAPPKEAAAKPGPKPRQPGEQRPTEGQTKRRVVADPPQREKRTPTDVRPNLTLRFAYEVLAGSTRLWEYNPDTGTLTFNVRHPIWVKLDETNGKHTKRNDMQIMHMQEWLTLKLLLLLSHHDDPDFDFEVARVAVDEEVKFYPEMFIIPK